MLRARDDVVPRLLLSQHVDVGDRQAAPHVDGDAVRRVRAGFALLRVVVLDFGINSAQHAAVEDGLDRSGPSKGRTCRAVGAGQGKYAKSSAGGRTVGGE